MRKHTTLNCSGDSCDRGRYQCGIVAEHGDVSSGGDCGDRCMRRREAACDGSHAQVIGEDQAGESHAFAKQTGENLAREGSGLGGIKRGEKNVSDHYCWRACGDGGGEGDKIHTLELFDSPLIDGQVLVRVHLRIAVTWKMLGATEDSSLGKSAQERGTHARDERWIVAKAADLRNGACGIQVKIEHRREIEIAADGSELMANRLRDFLDGVGITEGAELSWRGPLCERSGEREPCAAFLVNADEDGPACCGANFGC